MTMAEPRVFHATVREGGPDDDPCWDIECRFSDGQKFAAVQVDHRMEKLADWIAGRLNDRARIDAALKELREA
jgi:hypothetical protein